MRLKLSQAVTRKARFQFTHPVRGATCRHKSNIHHKKVSIHAPRAGCDTTFPLLMARPKKFQFTHPVRGATHELRGNGEGNKFQFTHPVRGATETLLGRSRPCSRFNSRTPCGVRLYLLRALAILFCFNSRTPCGVRHAVPIPPAPCLVVSIHAPRAGCDSMVQSCVLWRG